MHWAAVVGDRGLMDWLLARGADVDCPNSSEATALHAAARQGQAMSVSILLQRGADATVVHPLLASQWFTPSSQVSFLLQRGADA